MTKQRKYNTQNLKPFNTLTEEEKHDIRSKGGIASAAARRRRREEAKLEIDKNRLLEKLVQERLKSQGSINTALSLPANEKIPG